jgi:hypothetical protein
MIVNNGTRWLPEPETFGSNSGRGATLGTDKLAKQPQSFGWRSNGGRARQKSRVIGRIKLLMNFGDARLAALIKIPSAVLRT